MSQKTKWLLYSIGGLLLLGLGLSLLGEAIIQKGQQTAVRNDWTKFD